METGALRQCLEQNSDEVQEAVPGGQRAFTWTTVWQAEGCQFPLAGASPKGTLLAQSCEELGKGLLWLFHLVGTHPWTACLQVMAACRDKTTVTEL